jgi:hypothetical protein
MNTERKQDGGPAEADSKRDRTRETPGSDMQAEDAGTAASGSDGAAATTPARSSGTAAQSAMKQTSKTAHESGSRR